VTSEKATENPAAELPENLPNVPESQAETIAVRRGMFGAVGTGDTSGYSGLVRKVQLPGPTPRPYGGWFDETADALARALDSSGRKLGGGPVDNTVENPVEQAVENAVEQAVEKVVVDRGEITFHVRRERLADVARALRDDPALRFELCLGVSGVHYPQESGRELHAVYHLLSITHNRRIRLEVACPDADPHIPSLAAVYPTNDWHERETYDFFGIVFDGHPALTRIEMPDDWPGHPQRKDYPLGGIPVEYKGAQIPPPDERRSYS
jgi:NADH-quinone oxidoreductase subunit C